MSKRSPNWLLRGLVCVSLGIHLVIFMHVSGRYSSDALTYIELTLKDVSKPPTKNIPSPRHRPKPPPRPQDVKRPKVAQQKPRFKPTTKVEPVKRDPADSPVERVSTPDIPAATSWHIDKRSPEDMETSISYLEMVRLKIERHKEYPVMARIRRIEGRVTIRFVITPEGDIRATRVVKASGHPTLDTAALRAVQDAAPFPKPPPRFFKGEIPLEVTMIFELS
ncbi:MAG: energy transducer TonB [Desulfobacterales bacterium]|nr:energy transducer TonB [Desulfobacterales bacterium]